MDKKFTDEEIVEAAYCCTEHSCETCPLTVLGVGFEKCIIKFSEYITNNTKNEPAPAVTNTSSEVSVKEDTTSLDSTLLDICQDGLEEITKIYNNDYQVGYANAVIGIVKKLRGGDGK